jgi:hypothetical protein
MGSAVSNASDTEYASFPFQPIVPSSSENRQFHNSPRSANCRFAQRSVKSSTKSPSLSNVNRGSVRSRCD